MQEYLTHHLFRLLIIRVFVIFDAAIFENWHDDWHVIAVISLVLSNMSFQSVWFHAADTNLQTASRAPPTPAPKRKKEKGRFR